MTIGQTIYSSLKGEKFIWLVMLILPIFSALVVYSATGGLAHLSRGGNTEYYFIKHLSILAFGFMLVVIFYKMHYMTFAKISSLLLLAAIVGLLLTLFFGVEINGARRWIRLPLIDITFQTSDFAKVALVIYLAAQLSLNRECLKEFGTALLPVLLPVFLVCGLIAPADLSTAAMLFATCFIMMFIGQMNLRILGGMILIGAILCMVLLLFGAYFPEFVRSDTWASRLSAFFTGGGDTYQIDQAKIAIAEGGLIGLGPGNSIQRNFLPSPYSDFIYAIIVEEYGLIGGLMILFAFMLLFIRSVSLVTNSPKAFGAIVAIGLSISLTMQALLNMAVSVDLLPVTGLTLPLISMGGTSVLFACIAIGIILSVGRHVLEKDSENMLHKTEIAYEGAD